MRLPALIVAALVAVALPAAAQADDLPVPWTALAGSTGQDTAPAGSNDWTCKPTKGHPNPVVLVHGLAANRSVNWTTMSPFLANRGYCVFALTYGLRENVDLGVYQPGGIHRMQRSARELKRFVERVRSATGARKVDIVGHSEGATMPDYYIEYLGGAQKVQRYVGVSGVKHGTTLHGVGTLAAQYGTLFPGAPNPTDGTCGSCQQFLVGSDYIAAIEARAPAPGVTYTNIATRYDELVSPYTSSFLTGSNVTNIDLQANCMLDFSDHLSIISSPRTGRLILNALDPAHAKPVPCVPVLPAV